MSNRKSKTDTSISKQMSLLDNGLSEDSLDLSLGLKQKLSSMLKGMDRWIVAAQISRATGKELSKEMLDKIVSSDQAYQPSALQVTAIAALTGNLDAFRYLLEPLGSDVLDPADRDLIELARIQEKMKILEAEKLRIMNKRGLK